LSGKRFPQVGTLAAVGHLSEKKKARRRGEKYIFSFGVWGGGTVKKKKCHPF